MRATLTLLATIQVALCAYALPRSSYAKSATASTPYDNWDIYVMRRDGGSPPTRLTTAEGGDSSVNPAWSPDGRKLVFNYDQLFTMRRTGAANEPCCRCSSTVIIPTGRRSPSTSAPRTTTTRRVPSLRSIGPVGRRSRLA